MSETNINKSLYLAFCGILGVLMFYVLHRLLFFFLLYFSLANDSGAGLSMSSDFASWEYISLILVLIAGLWYGIWIGLYWYQKVYEEFAHKGAVDHIGKKIFPWTVWPKKHQGVNSQLKTASARLEKDLRALESVAKNVAVSALMTEPTALRRTIVRNRAPKKIAIPRARTKAKTSPKPPLIVTE